MNINITKADGSKMPFNADLINRSIERACFGLPDPISMVTQIATETSLTLYDGITTDEIDQATIGAAIQNVREDIKYDKVATRILLKTIYRSVVGDYDKDSRQDLKEKHKLSFINFVKDNVSLKRLDTRMEEKFNLEELANALDIERDELFQYAGLSGFLNRYSLKDPHTQSTKETPQYFFMRVAMGLSYNEENPTRQAKLFYDKMSRFEYIAGGSTNLGAGTPKPPLSNCFLLEIHDDMGHIAKSVSDVLMLSKASGGIGASITKLRAAGSPLMSNNGVSTGPTPFAKIIDTAIRAVQRGGKKKGALCFYMENWHVDFPEYIDWRHNAGDDYMRMRTANTACFLSDEFMNRVQNKQMWYMFDPKETPDLNELYGQAFSTRYAEYIEMSEAGKLRTFKKVPAEEQYRAILSSLQSTSHPWLVWKDSINVRAINNNTGTIHMSNLCTEICLPQDINNIAVCNLGSINVSAHILKKEVNWSRLEESVRLAVRQLDNLIDINTLPVIEAQRSDQENRAVGLGIMGLADTFEQLGIAYDTEHAYDFTDRLCEFISYMAIDESANLAQIRGSYKNFEGSRWSKGMVPVDTIAELEKERGMPVTVDKSSKHKGLNWDLLRAKVKKGMRNATLMAIAPNANIGLLVGTTPGIDPRFAQVFSRSKFSGKYLDVNHNLVKDLKNMGLWEKVKELIIEKQGDISDIAGIPEHLKAIYKTSFNTSPYGFIEVAARAQKWIDQAISRNMYLDTRDMDDIMKIYLSAWQKGLKSTYYLHMKPRHTAEQSTTSVNKAEQFGKKGIGAFASTRTTMPPAEVSVPSSIQQQDLPQPVMVPVQKPLEEQAYDQPKSVGKGAGFGAVMTAPQSSVVEPSMPVTNASVVAGAGPFAQVQGATTETLFTQPEPIAPVMQSVANAGSAQPIQSVPVAVAQSQTNSGAVNKPKYNLLPQTDPALENQCDSCQ